MTLPVSDIVSVQVQVAPSAPVAAGFGTGLAMGRSTILPLEERVRTYSTYAGVAVDFAANTNENKAAAAYFGQTPAPAQMMIGRQFLAAQAGKLRGSASVSALFSDYTGITNGGVGLPGHAAPIQGGGPQRSGAGSAAANAP